MSHSFRMIYIPCRASYLTPSDRCSPGGRWRSSLGAKPRRISARVAFQVEQIDQKVGLGRRQATLRRDDSGILLFSPGALPLNAIVATIIAAFLALVAIVGIVLMFRPTANVYFRAFGKNR